MLAVATAEGIAFISGAATILAALVLGGLAAWTADKRLGRQLAAVAVQQERELKAEAARQRASLAHDRGLADLADLRKLLDEAAVALNDARDARDRLDLSFSEHGVHLPEAPRLQLRECGNTVFQLLVRLHVRLGVGSPITGSFSDAAQALVETWQAVSHFEDDDAFILKEKRETVRAALSAFVRSYNAFTKAATERAGSVALESGLTSNNRT
jgi:hypothetical protein